jgi:glutamyl/glutaminyl-tRNA synthetase
VKGEAETVFALKGRTLTWRGHLLVTADQKNFYYKYTRELLKDGVMFKSKTWQETVKRDRQ